MQQSHLAISLIVAVMLLVLTGMVLGQGLGKVGVQVVDAVIAQVDGAE